MFRPDLDDPDDPDAAHDRDEAPQASQATKDRVMAQLTPETRRAALRYANDRAKAARQSGVRTDALSLYADELFNDAVTDTWMGRLCWDHERKSLLQHLLDVMRRRCWNDMRRAASLPHQSLRLPARLGEDDGTTTDPLTRDPQTALWNAPVASTGDVGPMLMATLLAEATRRLTKLAAGDPGAQLILECWRDGVGERSEVMQRTGLSAKAYKLSRERLMYLQRYLPSALADRVRDLLRSAS